MQKNIIVLLLVAGFVNLSFAQQILPRIYEYDAAGNRIVRKVLILRDSALQKNVNNHDSADYWYEDDMDDLNILIYPNFCHPQSTSSATSLHIDQQEKLESIDINGDGVMELLIIHPQNGGRVYKNAYSQNINFQLFNCSLPDLSFDPNERMHKYFGDVNGDGITDILIPQKNCPILILRYGVLTWATETETIPTDTFPILTELYLPTI